MTTGGGLVYVACFYGARSASSPFSAGERRNMPEWPLLRVLRGGPGTRSLSLDARRLLRLPQGLGYMKGLESLSLRGNRLRRLPSDIQALSRLAVLNLGNNIFEEVPEQLKYLTSLKKLYLFGNKVTKISPAIFDGLQNLVLLNLNNNQLSFLPPEIHRLENLECLSLDNNQLQCIPKEFCCLRKLRELHLSHNSIIVIPEEIGNLIKLKVLNLSRNQIEELPNGLCELRRLRVLDVAGNNIQVFPASETPSRRVSEGKKGVKRFSDLFLANIEVYLSHSPGHKTVACYILHMDELELKELYCEDNPLLEKRPVHAIQEEDVLTLKEITARFILAHLKDKELFLSRSIKQNSEVQKILSEHRDCAHCGSGFLNMWLECVQFVAVKQQTKTSRNLRLLPIRALLCSYKCFNHRDRELYGIAVP